MRYFLSYFFLVFCLQLGFAQIGFEENIIIDKNSYQSMVRSIYAADIDSDGDLDLLATSWNKDNIAWYENLDGLGSYGKQKVISNLTDGATSIYAADLDGDGDLDVLSASENDDKIAWYENTDGLGDFGEQVIISSTVGASASVYSVDIDGDGDMDVLSASNLNGVIAWYENTNGNGDFGAEQIVASSVFGAKYVHAEDIDGDGDVDVLSASGVNSNLNKIAWYENVDGLGSFGPQQIISTSAIGVNSIYTSDIDSDGDFDVLSSSNIDNKIAWYENLNGYGTFGSQQIISSSADGASSVYAADLDNDGDVDVLSASESDNKIAWYSNLDGQGSFGNQIIITTSAFVAKSVLAGDIDGDGDLDVISGSNTGNFLATYKNLDGQAAFGEQLVVTNSAIFASSIFASDIDNDGDLDVLSASEFDNKIAWYENQNGQGTFGIQKIITNTASNANSVYVADLDNDGDMDVLSTSFLDNKIAWYENMDGLGGFGEQQIISTILDNPTSVFSVDIDGDGDMDILVSSYTNAKIVWFENLNGQGLFGTQQVISDMVVAAINVHAADLDNDGDFDVLSASLNDDKIAWYENMDGQGTFGVQQNITTLADGANSVYAVDIDDDGDFDVVSASLNDNKIAWYENINGQGTFGSQQVITDIAMGARSVYSSDLDADGDMDVISASYDDNKIAWYENVNGQGVFSLQQTISEYAVDATAVFSVDIDNDGDFDVISASRGDDKIAWYENLGVLGNEINGAIKYDLNNNGCDENDLIFSANLVSTSNGDNSFSTFSMIDGNYELLVNEGNFSTQIENLPIYFISNPVTASSSFVGLGNSDSIDFCIEPAGVFNDLNINVYPSINNPRPGFDTTYQLVYNNTGTTQLSGDITFTFDDSKIQFLSASETLASQNANSLTFNFDNLNPFETRTIDLEFNVFAPPTTNIGNILVSSATINPVSGDEEVDDNFFQLQQIVIGSFDPNDITILQGDEILIEDADKYINVLIRFQNTGTASAINVRVEHVLDNKLDWTTMQLQSLSHTGRVEITDGNEVQFIFNNINLPDSTNDEPNSHGYIAYKIKPKNDVVVGDVVSGVADIYFDFNPAIITNTASTEFVAPLSVNEENIQSVKLHPNPTKEQLQISARQLIDYVSISDINGRYLQKIEVFNTEYSMDVSGLLKGIYFLEIQAGDSSETKKFIKN